MCILGTEDAPIEITDISGNEANVILYSTDNIVFENPIVPKKIVSVKLGSRELLQP